MSRRSIATGAGLLFVLGYIIAAVALSDVLGRMHWLLEAAYWLVAGILWVIPIRWLMLWSVGQR